MYLEIITPEKTLFKGEVDSVFFPGSSGDFQVLNNHAPIVSSLKQGEVKIPGKLNLDSSVKDQFEISDKETIHHPTLINSSISWVIELRKI